MNQPQTHWHKHLEGARGEPRVADHTTHERLSSNECEQHVTWLYNKSRNPWWPPHRVPSLPSRKLTNTPAVLSVIVNFPINCIAPLAWWYTAPPPPELERPSNPPPTDSAFSSARRLKHLENVASFSNVSVPCSTRGEWTHGTDRIRTIAATMVLRHAFARDYV